jgi:allophanate hydrolase
MSRTKLPPAAAPDTLAAEETALFCVGAHMSGLPLNQQIVALGGRFMRTVRTVPAYRLFALGNRPGMLRASDATGAAIEGEAIEGEAIEGEVWALPTAAIGALLAQVPSPLGFGTIALADGPCLGFLVEPAGIPDARDITSFGGWRRWLAAKEAA